MSIKGGVRNTHETRMCDTEVHDKVDDKLLLTHKTMDDDMSHCVRRGKSLSVSLTFITTSGEIFRENED